jgi:hypothetical protein
MNLLVEEERKDAAEAPGGGIDEKGGEKDSSKSEDEDEELADLPQDIAELLGSELFESEQALEEALVRAGVGDLPVVLVDKKPRLVMRSDQHAVGSTQLFYSGISCDVSVFLCQEPMGLLLCN